EALGEAGKLDRAIRFRAALAPSPNCVRDLAVDRRERLEVALGMAGGQSRHARRRGSGPAAGARDRLRRLAERREPELVGLLLVPLDAAAAAVHAQAQVVLVARCDLARPERAACTAGEAKHHLNVVVEAAAGDEGGELRAQLADLKTGDVSGELERVRADVADAAARAGARRVGPPFGLL